MRASTLLSESLAVLGKELTAELRSRVALNAVGLFGLTTLIAVAYQIGPYRIQEQDRPHLLAALLWVILFFAATSGLSRVFVKEEDAHTAKTLRLAARPLAVFAGKFLFNLILLAALYAFIVPLYCALMGYSVQGVASLALLLVVRGCRAFGDLDDGGRHHLARFRLDDALCYPQRASGPAAAGDAHPGDARSGRECGDSGRAARAPGGRFARGCDVGHIRVPFPGGVA